MPRIVRSYAKAALLFFAILQIGCTKNQNQARCATDDRDTSESTAADGETLDYTKTLAGVGTIEEAVEKVTGALSSQGFGVVTDMNVQAIMKKKLDKEMRPYRILGACNPKLAYQAIEREITMGLLLPCKVIVYQNAEDEFLVSFARPGAVFQLIRDPSLAPLAEEVDILIRKTFDSL